VVNDTISEDLLPTCIAPGKCRGYAAPDCATSTVRLGAIVDTAFFQVGRVGAVIDEHNELVVLGCGLYAPDMLRKLEPADLDRLGLIA
jgi:hypothetical protein